MVVQTVIVGTNMGIALVTPLCRLRRARICDAPPRKANNLYVRQASRQALSFGGLGEDKAIGTQDGDKDLGMMDFAGV